MTLKHAQEISANLERAQASLQAAIELFAKGYFDVVASRAYYAAFYAVTALLLAEELEFNKHSGAIAAIHQRWIKTGRLHQRYGKDLNWLFELRSVGDYGVTLHVSRQDAKKAIRAAEGFVRTASSLIQEVAE